MAVGYVDGAQLATLAQLAHGAGLVARRAGGRRLPDVARQPDDPS